MKDCVKLKKLNSFFYKNLRYNYSKLIIPDMEKELEYHKNIMPGFLRNHGSKKTLKCILSLETSLKYISELNLNNAQLKKICADVEVKWKLYSYPKFSSKPILPNRARDNKVHTTYEYSSICSKVRFPSLKRGRSTWKRFYEMFPRIAEEDKWNGKTSIRYIGHH